MYTPEKALSSGIYERIKAGQNRVRYKLKLKFDNDTTFILKGIDPDCAWSYYIPFKNGKLNGIVQIVNLNGNIESLMLYRKGVLETDLYFYENRLINEVIFSEDREVQKKYDRHGHLYLDSLSFDSTTAYFYKPKERSITMKEPTRNIHYYFTYDTTGSVISTYKDIDSLEISYDTLGNNEVRRREKIIYRECFVDDVLKELYFFEDITHEDGLQYIPHSFVGYIYFQSREKREKIYFEKGKFKKND